MRELRLDPIRQRTDRLIQRQRHDSPENHSEKDLRSVDASVSQDGTRLNRQEKILDGFDSNEAGEEEIKFLERKLKRFNGKEISLVARQCHSYQHC